MGCAVVVGVAGLMGCVVVVGIVGVAGLARVAGLACLMGVAGLLVHLLFFSQVIADITEPVAGVAWLDFEGFIDDRIEEVAVVRNDEKGAIELLEGLAEDRLRLHVEVIGRLIENKEVTGVEEHFGEGKSTALSTREDFYGFEDIVSGKKEASKKGSESRVGMATGNRLHLF